jgi:hypothetical protein
VRHSWSGRSLAPLEKTRGLRDDAALSGALEAPAPPKIRRTSEAKAEGDCRVYGPTEVVPFPI